MKEEVFNGSSQRGSLKRKRKVFNVLSEHEDEGLGFSPSHFLCITLFPL
jgi:hypothetical protein